MFFRTFLVHPRKVPKEGRQGANRLNFAFAKFGTRFPLREPLSLTDAFVLRLNRRGELRCPRAFENAPTRLVQTRSLPLEGSEAATR